LPSLASWWPISHLTRPFRRSSFTVGNIPDRYAPKAHRPRGMGYGTTVHCIYMLRGAPHPALAGFTCRAWADSQGCQPLMCAIPLHFLKVSTANRRAVDSHSACESPRPLRHVDGCPVLRLLGGLRRSGLALVDCSPAPSSQSLPRAQCWTQRPWVGGD
jgi:hypothetical protein